MTDTKELAKKTRQILNKNYPAKKGFKFSVTSTYNSISVAVLSAPFKAWDKQMLIENNDRKPDCYKYNVEKFLEESYEQVNEYYFKEDITYTSEMKQLLINIHDIISADNYIVNEDSDYGSIPNYYLHINIGAWDKPFIVKEVA